MTFSYCWESFSPSSRSFAIVCDNSSFVWQPKRHAVREHNSLLPLSTHLLSLWISIFTRLTRCSHCLFMLLCMFSGSTSVNKYKQMERLTQQSIRIVRGQDSQCVSALMSIMRNPIKWRAFRATYGPFHNVNDAMSSVIGAWLTSDWIVVYGLVDTQ